MMALLIIVLGLFALWSARHKMKKTICVILVLLVGYVVIANAMRPEIKYPAGRDTVESFGDGTYQIAILHAKTGHYNILYNEEYKTKIIPYVEQFFTTKDRAYIVGNGSWSVAEGETLTEYTYEIYAVIELKSNMLTLCVIPDSSLAPDMYYGQLDEMIKNGDIQLLNQLTDFSNEDRAVFEGLGH